MDKDTVVKMAFIIVGALALLFVLGVIMVNTEDENKRQDKRMEECFVQVKDPKWCYKNL